MKPYIVAMTGASGAIYGVRLLRFFAESNIPVELVVSDTAKIVMKEELGHHVVPERFYHDNGPLGSGIQTGFPPETCGNDKNIGEVFGDDKKGELLLKLGIENTAKIHLHDFKDLTAPIASGSYPTEGMIIIPCSMGTLGAIASGLSQNLIHRAADCTIKEGRKLVLVPRETPLSAIHLENMLKLARLGVRMVPPMPAFYGDQQKVEDLVDFVVGKVLDQFGIVHALYPRWVGKISGLETRD